MRWIFAALVFFVLVPGHAVAQNEDLDIVDDPICFEIINTADYTILGNFGTAEFTRPDGIVARHRSNFRLAANGTIDDNTGQPGDRAEFCSYGPFYEGRKLEVVLRTLFPVFSCYTKIDQGPLIIKGRHKPEGGVETWVECYN